jgi:hypothetical protein
MSMPFVALSLSCRLEQPQRLFTGTNCATENVETNASTQREPESDSITHEVGPDQQTRGSCRRLVSRKKGSIHIRLALAQKDNNTVFLTIPIEHSCTVFAGTPKLHPA